MLKDMKTAELLQLLNDHRTVNGQPTLKSWKGSRAQLIAKIEQFEGTKLTTNDKLTGTFRVADLARNNNVNPKIARARLRAQGQRGTHVYPVEKKDEILAIIKPS